MALFDTLAQAAATPTPVPADVVAREQANWLMLAVFFGMVLSVGVVMSLVPLLLGPRAQPADATQKMAYESGMPPIGTGQPRYTIRYYVIAMLFVVFDIEAVFFYPWAVAFNQIGWYGLIEMVLFIVLLFVAYIYAWRKGALDWAS